MVANNPIYALHIFLQIGNSRIADTGHIRNTCDIAGISLNHIVAYTVDFVENFKYAGRIDRRAFEFDELLLAADNRSQAHGGTPAFAGLSVAGADVAGSVPDQRHAFNAPRCHSYLAGCPWWNRILIVVRDLNCREPMRA
jgi:hypothetical protein